MNDTAVQFANLDNGNASNEYIMQKLQASIYL